MHIMWHINQLRNEDMRRSLIAITAFAAISAVAYSPAPASAQAIGFKLGGSFANLDIEDEEDTLDGITGFVGGGFIRFGTGRFSLQGELLSVTKGADFVGETSDDDAELRLEYIEIPVMLHVPLTYGTFSPYVLAGPTVSLESGCDFTDGTVSGDCDDADLFGRKKTDFGVTAGGGVEFAMGPGAILVEGRYTWGLSNINDSDIADAPSVKNRAAYLMAGYTIWLGR